jgi:LPXTG-motif cell wall-anchored protein
LSYDGLYWLVAAIAGLLLLLCMLLMWRKRR